MRYTLSLTRPAAEALQAHLLGDRSREQMAVTLCGVNHLRGELRLLARDVILLPPDAFRRQSAAQLEVKPEVQAYIHARAHRRGLVEVDWHSHPGGGHPVCFSGVDDHFEAAQAAYIAARMRGAPYGSVVVNDDSLDARLWFAEPLSQKATDAGGPTFGPPAAQPIAAILTGDLGRRIPLSAAGPGGARGRTGGFVSPIFDRQVRAFGAATQARLAEVRVGVIGVGGLGSALVAHLARLGVRRFVLVDPDVVELSNLNRLVNASAADARKARPKVYVARSSVRQAQPKAAVVALWTDVFDPRASAALKGCDLLVVATDNHSSRVAANRLAAQYLIPLVHTGFNIAVSDPAPAHRDKAAAAEPSVTDVSGEFALPEWGRWCLQCAGLIDPQQAAWELAPAPSRAALARSGYVSGTPAPAVGHLDGVVAALAAAEIHNLVADFKPQHRYLVYDARAGGLTELRVRAGGACPICSPEHGVLGLGDLEPLPDYRRAREAALPPADVGRTASPAAPTAAADTVEEEPPALPPAVHAAPAPAAPAALARRRLFAAMAQSELDWAE
jgi:molybdopterin/thiamine biosynthesis adenylyltransferase